MTDQPNQLIAALIAAQREFLPAVRNAENPFHKSTYVTLDAAWAACREGLWNHGLTVIQITQGTTLITRLVHVSGESIEASYPLAPTKEHDPQALGSALTYARRYTLMALVGLCPEDDDGNAASGKTAPNGNRAPVAPTGGNPSPKAPASPQDAPKQATPDPTPTDEPATQKQRGMLWATLRSAGVVGDSDPEEFQKEVILTWCGAQLGRKLASGAEITKREMSGLIKQALTEKSMAEKGEMVSQ